MINILTVIMGFIENFTIAFHIHLIDGLGYNIANLR